MRATQALNGLSTTGTPLLSSTLFLLFILGLILTLTHNFLPIDRYK